ncbi:MAG: nucleotidyltransferase domain-containing protein [Candidatus Korarchaeum sp.]|nr:nucleotidyltransferase domain-containing protein [Candidatus Korarchaeum sp.]
MRESLRRAAERFAERVTSAYGRALVIIFGSRARMEEYATSDTDILVVLDRATPEDLVRLAEEARRSGIPSPEIHLYTFERLEEAKGNAVIMDAILEGVPIIDTENLMDRLRKSIEDYVRERKLVKTRCGWFRDKG